MKSVHLCPVCKQEMKKSLFNNFLYKCKNPKCEYNSKEFNVRDEI